MGDVDLGRLARSIVRSADRAALGTLQRNGDGHPLVTHVALATRSDGTPLLLLSGLSEHTRNVADDARVSLLAVASSKEEDPLAGPRVTLIGRLGRLDEGGDRARYLRRHPAASLYAGFQDFAMHVLAIERAHLVAGFGTARWLKADRLSVQPLFDEADAEEVLLDRMEREDRALLDGIAGAILGVADGEAVATGIDREGLDLRAGARTGRAPFEPPLAGAHEVPAALERLPGV